ncbi:hypothetical protein BH18ACT4_BH18ACT4_16090 [soil metagenome]
MLALVSGAFQGSASWHRCSGVADVIAAVRFGREHDLNPARRLAALGDDALA